MSVDDIKNLGFPIVCVMALGYFMKWYIEYLHKQYNDRLEKRDAIVKDLMLEIKNDRETLGKEIAEFTKVLFSFKELIEINFKK